METKNEVHKSDFDHYQQVDPPISLQEAIDRGKRWSDLLGELPEFKGINAKYKPKALFIPYHDLKELIEYHERNHHHVKGVRVYLGLVPKQGPVTYDLRGSVVAVNMEDKDIIKKPGDFYSETNGIGDIYDFTAPCPDVCDTKSPLFQL